VESDPKQHKEGILVPSLFQGEASETDDSKNGAVSSVGQPVPTNHSFLTYMG